MELHESYSRLPARLYERIRPAPVRAPQLLLWNAALAHELGIPAALAEDREALARVLAGNELLPGSRPLALAYAGHQFGNFVPRLGDGRAHLLGELFDRAGRRRDLQLKGSGPTSFSRGGDGRCALGPAVRELLMSEALHALGVPTTRCLAVVTTGEPVLRERPLPGAVVSRVAASHLRVGSLQYCAARGDTPGLRALLDHAIWRHHPELEQEHAEPGERYLALLERVIEAQLQLVAGWMRIGFIHGVMNTDNTALSGQTIDFGPCAMMSRYDPRTVFSSIDARGRYAFGNQPAIAAWNLTRLAECLLPVVADDARVARERLEALTGAIPARFSAIWSRMMARKLGLREVGPDDRQLLAGLLDRLEARGLDYTVTFRRLGRSLTEPAEARELGRELGPWYDRWQQRLAAQERAPARVRASMERHNPAVIPRNHHVEAALQRCVDEGQVDAVEQLLEVLLRPYDELPQSARYQDPPADGDRCYQTFCGT